MRTPADKRVWLDKSRIRDVYGAFRDQRFYSVEYTGPDRDHVIEFAEKCIAFSEWAKEAVGAAQRGTEIPPPPEFIKPKRGRPPVAKAQEDAENGSEGSDETGS